MCVYVVNMDNHIFCFTKTLVRQFKQQIVSSRLPFFVCLYRDNEMVSYNIYFIIMRWCLMFSEQGIKLRFALFLDVLLGCYTA
jgi:hypothetical protein